MNEDQEKSQIEEYLEHVKGAERSLLLKKCFGYASFEIIELLRRIKNDDDFKEVFYGSKSTILNVLRKPLKCETFRGRCYTVSKGELLLEGSWGIVKENLLNCIYGDQGKTIKEILDFILGKGGAVDSQLQ